MIITNKLIKRVMTGSVVAGIIFFVISLVFFLFSATLDYMIVIALSIAVLPAAILGIIRNQWKAKIEKATPEFLRDLATASKTGIPLQVALEHASRRNMAP
jgi:pilus assembly protein TadC